MSNEALKSLTMSFFYGDADDKIPERLAAVNPVKLVRAINRELLKRNRRKHATLNLFKVTSNMLAFLKYFDIARKDLKGYVSMAETKCARWRGKSGSFKFRVGYRAWGLIWAKSSFPAIRNRTVRSVAKRL